MPENHHSTSRPRLLVQVDGTDCGFGTCLQSSLKDVLIARRLAVDLRHEQRELRPG